MIIRGRHFYDTNIFYFYAGLVPFLDIAGGCGGGILYLNVSGLMKIDGKVSINGQSVTSRAGGGSGGSLYFQADHFDGTGLLQVIWSLCPYFMHHHNLSKICKHICLSSFSGAVQ